MATSEDRKTLRELLAGGGRQMGAAFAGLVTFPIIARVLDDERLGIWALLGAAAFLLNLSDLGLTTSIQRAAVAQDMDRARRLLGLATLVQLLILPIGGVVAFFLLLDLPKMSPAMQLDAEHAAVVALCAGALYALASPYRGLVLARGGIRKIANARIIASVTQVTVIAVGFTLFKSLLVPATGLLFGYIADTMITLRAARDVDRHLPVAPAVPPDKTEVRAAFRDGGAQLVINLSVATALRVDLFVLVRVAPLAVVAAYGVAGRAIDQCYLVAKQAVTALMPRLGDPEHRARALRIGTAVFGTVIVSGMSALALDGQPVLVAWVGNVAAGHAPAVVLGLLAVAAVLMSTYEVASAMVMLSARTGWSCAIPIVIGSALNLAVSISGAGHFGIWAVAGSTVVGNSVTLLLMWTQARRLLGWPLLRTLGALAPLALAGTVAATVGSSLAGFAHDGFLASLGVCILTTALGCGAGALVMRIRAARRSAEVPAPQQP